MADVPFCYGQPRLTNDLVILEPFEPTIHTTPLVSIIKSNPDLLTYIPFPTITSEAEFMQEVYDKEIRSNPGYCVYAITDRLTPPPQSGKGADKDTHGSFAGIISLFNTNQTDAVTEMGVVIFPAFQRTHVATNAIGLVLRWVMDPPSSGGLGLRRVQWKTRPDNAASRRIASRLGFELEGVLRWDCVFHSKAGISADALRVRNGTEREAPGRHTAIYSIVWDEWDEKRAKLVELMERTK